MKYFLYARKSSESEDRQVASIDSQIQELTKIAKREGIEILEILSESQSAKAPGRPVFTSMITRISSGEASGIICWKLDRLARNPIDGGTISWMLQQGLIQHVRVNDRSYLPTDNVLMMSVEFGMANQFVRDLSQVTRRGMKSKAERGWYPSSWLTLGYQHNRLRKAGDPEIIQDNERFPLVRKMFDMIIEGNYTVPEVWNIAVNEWGLRTTKNKKLARSTVYRILTDPFYYGKFEWPKHSGNWQQGSHVPMISETEYDKIQAILGRKGKPRPQKNVFAYTGIIRCGECGASITAEPKVKRQKNGNIHFYTYYHCTKRINPNCKQKSIEVAKLEEQIADRIKRITISQDFYEWAMAQLKERNAQESELHADVINNHQRAYKACVAKLDNLIDMRAGGEITKDDFSSRKEILLQEKKRIQGLLDDIDHSVNSWMKNAETVFDFAATAKKRFETGSLKEKGKLLMMLGSNLTLTNKELHISLEKPLEIIQEASLEIAKIEKRLEPLENALTKEIFWDAYDRSPTLLPG